MRGRGRKREIAAEHRASADDRCGAHIWPREGLGGIYQPGRCRQREAVDWAQLSGKLGAQAQTSRKCTLRGPPRGDRSPFNSGNSKLGRVDVRSLPQSESPQMLFVYSWVTRYRIDTAYRASKGPASERIHRIHSFRVAGNILLVAPGFSRRARL